MRIILPKEDIKGERVTISGEKARYLISVLRCNAGDELQILDNEGNCYKSRITGIENKKVTVDLLERFLCDTESPLNLILIQGILKGEKMDMVIQKTTELGVKEIIPAITERSQVRHTRKTVRWRKIAEEASRQCGRTMVPVIHEAINFCDIFGSNPSIPSIIPPRPPLAKGGLGNLKEGVKEGLHGSQSLNGLIFYEEGGIKISEAIEKLKASQITEQRTQNTLSLTLPPRGGGVGGGVNSQLSTLNSQLFIAIGPEGGFTKEEVTFAVFKGLIATSLGKRILRSETAAISAVALIQFLIGDINQS